MATALPTARSRQLRRGLALEYFTVGWNLLEAVVALVAGVAAGSVALIGFGIDSLIESSSAGVLIWRLRSERAGAHGAAEVERVAVRLVALAFFALAGYVSLRSIMDLVSGSRPHESLPGLVLAAVSLVVMPLLAHLKKRTARELDSASLGADSVQTWVCAYLSAFLLLGLGANALLGWWWADPAAGLAIAAFALNEGRELWSTDDLCCP